jgi:predicted ATPase/DNA-binding SARP family transcriptional activator/predicted negative regulator of RcsB-dependent stress response
MVAKLELSFLGNPEVRLAGHLVTGFRSAKAYALLYYLAVTRRAQPRTVLAGLFWGDVGEYYARRNFNRTLSNLTQLVGEHLVVERQTVVFARSQPYWLDVEQLEEAAATMPTVQNADILAATAQLYRGDFLDGFYVQEAPEFEQWVLTERTRLRASVLHLLHNLSQHHSEEGELTQGMEYARRILQLEPWREEAHRQLILLLAQSGQRSAALAQYELCRQALSSELNVEPDAATLDLVARIRAGGFDKEIKREDDKGARRQGDKEISVHPVAPSPLHPITPSPLPPVTPSPPHNLPNQPTPFVGRKTELAEITRLLLEEEDCRLLTLIGPGGMGKTRLALMVSDQLIHSAAQHSQFADGIFFVPLENVSETTGVISAIISVISEESGFPLHVNAPLQEQLAHFLRPKSMLLVLDNFEHLVKQATWLSDLLAAAPRLKLLITSREVLGLQEAWLYPVAGLTVPSSLAKTSARPNEDDAIQLFVQCARRTRPGFALEAELAAVLHICTLVEGMPLGIELAAAWLKVMTCEQIAQEVARGLDFLTARYQNIPARHRSMRAVMDHSWALLSPEEEGTIARLSIFRGKFRQEAASAIISASLFTLATLVEKALVRVTPDGYYQLHELTRQYAEEKLASATRTTLRDAHAIYYADLLDQQRVHLFTESYRQVWVTVGGELDNIRHAWHWIIEAVAAGRYVLPATKLLRQMAEVLTCYHLFHGLWLPGEALFDHARQVLEAAGWQNNGEDPEEQPSRRSTLLKLQISAGQFELEMGRHRASLALAERTLAASRAFGLEDDLFRALMIYGHTQVRRGARNEAAPLFQEALVWGEQKRSPRYCAEALIGLGLVASGEGRYADAQGYYRQGLAFSQEMEYRPWVARILTNRGTTYFRQHNYQQALPYYEQALTIAQEEGDENIIMINTSNLGGMQRIFGQHRLSLDYYQRSLAMARRLHEERWIAANLNGISITYLELNELSAAEPALREALMVGQQSDSAPDTLGSIGLLAHLFARRGQVEEAIKALLYVEQHPATLARDRVYNEPLLAELRSELPPALFEQAAAWAATQTLDDVVRWLLQGAV